MIGIEGILEMFGKEGICKTRKSLRNGWGEEILNAVRYAVCRLRRERGAASREGIEK
jgi:hypothetical protein